MGVIYPSPRASAHDTLFCFSFLPFLAFSAPNTRLREGAKYLIVFYAFQLLSLAFYRAYPLTAGGPLKNIAVLSKGG
jgi:hypothetical protein